MTCSIHQIESGAITIGLDGASTFPKLEQQYDPPPKIGHYDIVMAIRRIMRKLPIKVTLRYIEAHQDKHSDSLDWWGRQNVRMDAKAKLHWKRTAKQAVPNLVIGRDQWSIAIKEIIHYNCSLDRIYDDIHETTIRDYWAKKGHIPWDRWREINWKAQDLASRKLPPGSKRWLMKNHSGHCATGASMETRHLQNHAECPLCSYTPEKIIHVIICKDHRAKSRWDHNLTIITQWFIDNHAMPELAKIIINRL
jgi:hypothetical protein